MTISRSELAAGAAIFLKEGAKFLALTLLGLAITITSVCALNLGASSAQEAKK